MLANDITQLLYILYTLCRIRLRQIAELSRQYIIAKLVREIDCDRFPWGSMLYPPHPFFYPPVVKIFW